MTNSEKIKAYLDAGRNVKVGDYNIYKRANTGYIIETPSNIIYSTDYFDAFDSFNDYSKLVVSIHQEPLRYPNVGDKVVDLRTGEIGEVWECLDFCCIVDDVQVDYRNLAPYLD